MRPDRKFWLIVPFLCLWPLGASADDGDVAKAIAECGAPDLAPAAVDSCLERVRVLEETESSSQLQTLEASLEQRESGRPARAPAATVAAAPRAVEVAPEPERAAEGEGRQDELASQYPVGDSSPPQSGLGLEDEPPVADAPDDSSGAGSGDEDANDPPER